MRTSDREPVRALPLASRPAGTDLALLLLRLVLAAVFGVYGYAKWGGGMDRVVALFMTVHLPFPAVTARAVAILESGGAVLLLLGIGVRVVGGLLAIEMAVAITKVVWPQGFLGGYAFELTLLTVALALAAAGGGAYSVPALLGGRRLSASAEGAFRETPASPPEHQGPSRSRP